MEERLSPRQLPSPSRIAPQLKQFALIQIALSLACAISELFCSGVLHLGAPYNYPLKVRAETFLDFRNYRVAYGYFHSPAFFTADTPFLYPAPVAPLYWVFFRYRAHPMALFLCFMVATVLVSGFLLCRALYRRGLSLTNSVLWTSLLFLLAYPIWFEFKQANIEICIWVFVACGVWAFIEDRGYAAAGCIGLAASMKIFPFVYFGLLLPKRKYTQIVFGVILAVLATVISLWMEAGPHISYAWNETERGVSEFRALYMLHNRATETGFDHSLFAIYKRFCPRLPAPAALDHILTIYLIVAALCGTAVYFLRIWRLPVINQLICLTVASVLLPPVSYEYTLIHLYIPLGLLALLIQERGNFDQRVPGINAAFACFAVLLSPLPEFIYHGERFGGQIKALTLVTLFCIALKYPFMNQTQANPESHLSEYST